VYNLTDKQVLELSSLTALTTLNLGDCRNVSAEGLCAVNSLTGLTTFNLSLPASCAEDAAYAEAVCGLTTLTTLRFVELRERDVGEAGEWLLDLSRLTSLTSPTSRVMPP
jgi:hypothetical protein